MFGRLIDLVFRTNHFPLDQFPFTIGRANDVTYKLADRFASRFHCRIDLIDDRLILTDLGSRHGTDVNGIRVTSVEIHSGDVMRIGMHAYQVKRSGSHLIIDLVADEPSMVNLTNDSKFKEPSHCSVEAVASSVQMGAV